MGGLSWWHWLIILAAFILLFGAKKLPDAARGVGRSLRILKSEVSAMHEDDEKAKKATSGETDATAVGGRPRPRRSPRPRPRPGRRSARRPSSTVSRWSSPAPDGSIPVRQPGDAPDSVGRGHDRSPCRDRHRVAGDSRGQSLRSTVTTRPRMTASSPGIGS